MLTALRADRLLTLRVPLRQPGLWVPKGVLPAMLSAFFGASLSRVCALLGMVLGSVASARAAAPLALWVAPAALLALINAICFWTPIRAMGELALAAVDGRALPQGLLLVLLARSGAAALVTEKSKAATARRCSDRVNAVRRASAPGSCGLSSDPDARRRRS